MALRSRAVVGGVEIWRRRLGWSRSRRVFWGVVWWGWEVMWDMAASMVLVVCERVGLVREKVEG